MGILSTFVSVSVLCVSYCCCCYKPAGQTVKHDLGLCLEHRHPHHASTGGWGKERGALDLESTAKHDILSNGSDYYLQSFVSVPVIHVRHAKQGWFSFLVEWIVNPERFLLLFSLSFLITHTPTQWVWPLHQFHLVWSETVEWVGKPKPICLDCFCLHPKSGPLSDFCLVSHLV